MRPLPGKEAKTPPSPRSRLWEGNVQLRVVSEVTQVMDFETNAAFFALSPEKQAEVARRVREDAERSAAKQAEVEAERVAKESERLEKAKATQELMAATAAKLKEHRRPQQGERVEYQVLRVG